MNEQFADLHLPPCCVDYATCAALKGFRLRQLKYRLPSASIHGAVVECVAPFGRICDRKSIKDGDHVHSVPKLGTRIPLLRSEGIENRQTLRAKLRCCFVDVTSVR